LNPSNESAVAYTGRDDESSCFALPISETSNCSMKQEKVHFSGYISREEEILARCRGQRVMHLGCVGFPDLSLEEKITRARNGLHQSLSQISDCVGIDIDQTTVEQLRSAGVFNNVLVGDAEQLGDLSPTLPPFDIALAGDIIEHLSNPGRMLDGIKKRLKPNGRLIISTPNSMGLPGFLRYLAGKYGEAAQHVVCFNALTLTQLLERHGYEVMETFTCYQPLARKRLLFKAGRAFFRCFPRLGGTLFFVARTIHATE
jgi:2-polyprenyl-3-methyl-5-hydroxy-6-metoxy-1,4-benzoquinol methylase